MEYRHLIKNPKYSTIWRKAYGKELGRLAQGIPGTVQGTNTIVFISKHDIPIERCRTSPMAAYVHISNLKKMTHIEYVSLSVATESSFLVIVEHPQPTCSQPRSFSTASFQLMGHTS
jgi:hypothetical protein